MDSFDEDHLFQQNKLLDERFNYLVHLLESRIDKLFRSRGCQLDLQTPADSDGVQELFEFDGSRSRVAPNKRGALFKEPFSSQTFLTFRYPYIRDLRNFSSPMNEDSKQIQQLPTGLEDVEKLWRQKQWSTEAREELKLSVLDNYAKSYLLKLIGQKNQLLASKSVAPEDVSQKVSLIDEQAAQVRERKEPRIFVPADRFDKDIDWCAISAKISSYHHEAKDCRLIWSNQLHWSINDQEWTKDEDIGLINAVALHGKNNWDSIASELDTGRLAWQCCSRYHQQFACVESSFQPESDETEKILEVINLCRIGNFVPWNQVMYFIQSHSLHQVKHQWQRHLDQQRLQGAQESVRTKEWSLDEDLLLLQAVAQVGEREWARVAYNVPGRSNKSCRERYTMRARFARRALGSWLPHEDSKLLALVQQFGPSWCLLASHFAERNNHQIRSRYELLKSQEVLKRGPIKHRKLYRSLTSQSVQFDKGVKRHKPADERELDRKLSEIFATYGSLNKKIAPKKTLTCRSHQDEQIYQCLVETLCDTFLGCDKPTETHLGLIMREAVKSCTSRPIASDGQSSSTLQSQHSCIITPSIPTLQAYKAWRLQQDYLQNLVGGPEERNILKVEDIDERITKIVVGIFLLPALLSKIKPPQVADPTAFQIGSIIDKQSKNLYKIRNLQSNLLKRL